MLLKFFVFLEPGVVCQYFIVLSYREFRNTAVSDACLAKANVGNVKSIQKARR